MAELKRPDSISGYNHPGEMNYSRQSIYKTFTEGKKARKKEKFGNTTVGKQYSTYGEFEEELCPTCNAHPVQICSCGYSDKRCGSGHVWYTDRYGALKTGNPHVRS